MFRTFLVLLTAAVAVVVTGFHNDLLERIEDQTASLVGSEEAAPALPPVLTKPVITVTDAPTSLILREPGTVTVTATAPAVAGDTVILNTAGTYGMGYNKVSVAVLDEDLSATLDVTGRLYLGSYNYFARIPATATYQESRSKTFPIAIVTAGAQAAPTCGDEAPLKADGSAWVCSYNDEFDGTSLDRKFWVPQVTATSGFTTGTPSRYACAVDSPDTIAVKDGRLELSLVELPAVQRCNRNKSSAYAFGQVMHFQTYSQTYGKYEVRAKIPDLDVSGSQQSFWLWPKKNSYGPWPASGEIDFAELYSSTPNVDRPYLHYLPGETAAGTNKNVTNARCAIKPGVFNTYGVEWKAKQITVLLNGEVCFTNDYSSAAAALQGANSPFDKPFYLSLNQAMGTTGNEYDAAQMPEKITTLIDYVRIWK